MHSRSHRSRFDTEARIAVTQAADIARELGHHEVGPDHLVLGLLANTRGAAYAVLTDHGLRLDTARDVVAEQHVDAVEPEGALEGSSTDPLAAERASYDADRDALRAIGIDLDQVRQAVQDNLGQDLSDSWASRPDRRRRGGRDRGEGRGEGRGRGHGHHHRPDRDERDGRRGRGREGDEAEDHGRSARGEGRGRRGPRSRRAGDPRFSRELRELLRGVRRSARAEEDPERHGPGGQTGSQTGSQTGVPTGGLTGARLLLALTRSEDPVVEAILARATDLDGLRHEAETLATATA